MLKRCIACTIYNDHCTSLSGSENAWLYTMQDSDRWLLISCTIRHSLVQKMRCWSHGADNWVIISKAISSFLWSFLPVIRGLLCRRFSPKHNMLKDLPKFGDNTPLLGQLLGDDLQQVALHLLQAAISTHLHPDLIFQLLIVLPHPPLELSNLVPGTSIKIQKITALSTHNFALRTRSKGITMLYCAERTI